MAVDKKQSNGKTIQELAVLSRPVHIKTIRGHSESTADGYAKNFQNGIYRYLEFSLLLVMVKRGRDEKKRRRMTCNKNLENSTNILKRFEALN